MGVFAPLVGMIGTMQATEALKILLDVGTSLCGKLLVMDALHMEVRTINLVQDQSCTACGGK
jgi:molybdopterin/thiamine biosynthesis adenylyltransferase